MLTAHDQADAGPECHYPTLKETHPSPWTSRPIVSSHQTLHHQSTFSRRHGKTNPSLLHSPIERVIEIPGQHTSIVWKGTISAQLCQNLEIYSSIFPITNFGGTAERRHSDSRKLCRVPRPAHILRLSIRVFLGKRCRSSWCRACNEEFVPAPC